MYRDEMGCYSECNASRNFFLSALSHSCMWWILLAIALNLGTGHCYLNEPHAPFVITSPTAGQVIQRGETVNVTWYVAGSSSACTCMLI